MNKIILVFLFSQAILANPINDFQTEQTLFFGDSPIVASAVGKTGSQKANSADKQQEVRWSQEAKLNDPGYRISLLEYKKSEKNLRVRTSTYVQDKLKSISECESTGIDGIITKSEGTCVTVTGNICQRVLKKFRSEFGNSPSAAAKKIQECQDVFKKYASVMSEFQNVKNTNQFEFQDIVEFEQKRTIAMMDSVFPARLKYNSINGVNDSNLKTTEDNLKYISSSSGLYTFK